MHFAHLCLYADNIYIYIYIYILNIFFLTLRDTYYKFFMSNECIYLFFELPLFLLLHSIDVKRLCLSKCCFLCIFLKYFVNAFFAFV